MSIFQKTSFQIFFAFVTQFPQNPNGPLIESISSVRLLGGAGLDGKSKIISKILNTFDTEKEIISLEMIPWWINPKIGTIQFSNCFPINKLYTPAQEMITSSPLRSIKRSTRGPQLRSGVRDLRTTSLDGTWWVTGDHNWPKWSFTTYLPFPRGGGSQSWGQCDTFWK